MQNSNESRAGVGGLLLKRKQRRGRVHTNSFDFTLSLFAGQLFIRHETILLAKLFNLD